MARIPSRLSVTTFAGGAIAALFAFTTSYEGLRQNAYSDAAGVVSICYGHTGGVKLGDHLTKAQCEAIAKKDLDKSLAFVDSVTKVKLSDQQRIAFADFVYNVGSGTYQRSSVLRLANAGKLDDACKFLVNYSCITVAPGSGDVDGPCGSKHRTHHILKGLYTRRVAERDLCLGGDIKLLGD